jgi:hypothetical protein
MDEQKKAEINSKKSKLRSIAADQGEQVILQVAQGKKVEEVSQTMMR